MKNNAILMVLLGVLAACNAEAPDDSATTGEEATANMAQVTGTLMYRERIALPPGAVALVQLSDTSLADMFSYAIAYQEIA